MTTSNWKDVLRSQHEELGRLEEMDAAINQDDLTADIDRILRRQPLSGITARATRHTPEVDISTLDSLGDAPEPPLTQYDQTVESTTPRATDAAPLSSRSMTPRSRKGSVRENAGQESPNSDPVAQLPPDTQARYLQARNKILAKQVEDNVDLRKQLNEQMNDIQRQLKTEREENKKLNKRIQLLEVENKRMTSKKPTDNTASNSLEALTQEIAGLQRDLQTAERIAKQSEASSKAKDVQLKRATEAIAKLKTQLSEQQQQSQGGSQEERSRCEAAEARVRTLERQRADLIAAFRKQMKLIDILKRQKVHIEAARLLSFTEEEFMKALDWTA